MLNASVTGNVTGNAQNRKLCLIHFLASLSCSKLIKITGKITQNAPPNVSQSGICAKMVISQIYAKTVSVLRTMDPIPASMY